MEARYCLMRAFCLSFHPRPKPCKGLRLPKQGGQRRGVGSDCPVVPERTLKANLEA